MDFNNTGAMRSPFSPRVRQPISGRRSLNLSSVKKNPSQLMQSASEAAGDIIYKTPSMTLETFGLPLPVMVTEALTFGSGDVSVRISECGWCWLVTGRRILAWPYLAAPDENGAPLPAGALAARELTLPQTDLAHKADLVRVFYSNGAQMPSCVGVSPEGVVRFWSSVAQDVHVDVACELAGQECELLTEASGALVLATTTCTLVVLTPTNINGRETISCRMLRPPSGWLGGIGRRVSHLFFGAMPVHAETKLVGVVGVGGTAEEPHIALVSGGPVVQLWRGAELTSHNLRRALTDTAHHLVPHGEPSNVEVLPLDVHGGAPGELLLLLAVANVQRPQDVRYGIARINIADMSRLCVVGVAGGRGAWDVRCVPLGEHAVLYCDTCLWLSHDKGELLSLSGRDDAVLHAARCGPHPLLLTRKHGLLLLRMLHVRSTCDSGLGSPCPSDMYDGNLSLFEIDPHEMRAVTSDACGKLKTAFLFHLRRDISSSRAVLLQLFPTAAAADTDVDADLDRTVYLIAREMLDDLPAGDPRWKQRPSGAATVIALGSSAALQIAAQLQDKKRAFALFVDFLRAAHLWPRLGNITIEGGGCVSTEAALGALAENLAAAIVLRRMQQDKHAHLIDAAIYQVICGENPEVEEEPEVEAGVCSGALSPSDVCYRRVSGVPRVLVALARARPAHGGDASGARHALATIEVLTAVVSEMHKVRAQWSRAAPPAARARPPRDLLPHLLQLQRRAVSECAHACADGTLRAQLLEAAGALTCCLLAGAEPLLASPHTAHIYENMRRDAILPFLSEGEPERAAALAEKFLELEVLVRVCVQAGQLDRLQEYIDKYADLGMAETAYAWLCGAGGAHGALLVRRLGGARLAAWLRAAPARAPLAALLHLAAAPATAADLLTRMAEEETENVDRMKTMASLGKLCAAAAGGAGGAGGAESAAAWRRADTCLALSAVHEALPRDLQPASRRTLSAEHLVQLYIQSDSPSLTEYEYKQALDLTHYIQDMERRDELRLRIWCATIRRSDGECVRAHDPAAAMRHMMFFRLVELVHVMGGDLELLLPPLEDILTAPELADLVSEPEFHYLLKYGYECLHDKVRTSPHTSPRTSPHTSPRTSPRISPDTVG